MTDLTVAYDGMLENYSGDIFFAIFGAPLPLKRSAENACTAGLEMQKALDSLNKNWRMQGLPKRTMGIGIHTGEMTIGNVGHPENMNYRTMGNGVTIALNLESLNPVYGSNILMSEFTYEHVSNSVVAREIDTKDLGILKVTARVYELLAVSYNELPDRMREVLGHYNQGMEAYKKKLFDKSLKHFKRALKASDGLDKPSQIYVDRCQKALGE
jgi:adenylate cyclase